MKHSLIKKLSLVTISAVVALSLSGCSERISESKMHKHGKHWSVTKSTEVDRLPNGKLRIEKEAFYERYVCLKGGKHIKADNRKNCTEQGGKTYFEKLEVESESVQH